MSAGILCSDQVRELIHPPNGGTMRLYNSSYQPLDDKLIAASAIDLPLGDRYWEMKGSCRTGKEYKVSDLIHKHSSHPSEPKSLAGGPVTLKRRHVYLFEADCELDLTNMRVKGKATGRSSVGRLDVLVRLLVNESERFDFVVGGTKHQLFVEVTPISFDLEVKRGTTLSQLRLYKGEERDISLTKRELYYEEDDTFPVVNESGQPYREPCEDAADDIWFPFRLDLAPDPIVKCSAFVTKNSDGLSPIDPDKKAHYNPRSYWEPIESKDDAIALEPDRLYILRSKERLRIPKHLALECKSYTTEMGEWRIEYAGFAHPYFGSLRDDKKGSPIIFEVRGHNVPTILTHEIPLGNVRFLRMSKPASNPGETSYEKQELALSKCFRPWNEAPGTRGT
jgi:dCTP deaminase